MLIEPVQTLWYNFITSLPGFLAAIVWLIIGFIVGKVIGRVVKEILVRVKIDTYVTHKQHMMFKISDVFSLIARWWIYLVFIQQATIFLNVAALTQFTGQIINFLPNMVGAGIIVIVGYVLATYLKDKIITSKTLYSDIVGKLIFFLLIYVSIALALPLLKIDPTIVNWILLIIVGSIGLGLAIALGLGLKDVVAEVAKEYEDKFRRRR